MAAQLLRFTHGVQWVTKAARPGGRGEGKVLAMRRSVLARGGLFARRGIVALLAVLLLAPPATGQAQELPYVIIWFLGFNTTQPPFDNLMARRAVAAALDRARLASADDNALANSFEPPGCLAHNPGARPQPYSPDQAKALLAQSGVKLDEVGSIGLWYLSALRRGNSQAELQIVSANLAAVGMEITLREFGTYNAFDRIATLPVVKMSYWGIGAPMAVCGRESFLEDLAHTRGAFNKFGYRNAQIDALIEQAIRAGDRATKIRLYHEVERKVLDEVVVVPIWYYIIR